MKAEFRGQDKHGNWHYGELIHQKELSMISNYIDGTRYSETVIPKTIGQHREGLCDRQGKPMYDGDIVRILYTDWPSQPTSDGRTREKYLKDISQVGVLTWNKTHYCLVTRKGNMIDLDEGEHGRKEVIGNIHDNPEFWDKGLDQSDFIGKKFKVTDKEIFTVIEEFLTTDYPKNSEDLFKIKFEDGYITTITKSYLEKLEEKK